jgi:Flp pilus assembly pilin Flp
LLIDFADKRSQLAQRTLQEADGAQAVGTAVIAAMAILICVIVVGDAGTVLISLRNAFGKRT